MPSSFTGLVLFVLLLAPGFVFAAQRERRAPRRQRSAFGETVLLGLTSFLCDAAALLVFALLRAAIPDHTPDLGRLVREGRDYFDANYSYITWWALGLLALACAFGFVLGRWPPRFATIFADDITFTSAWWDLFERYRDAKVYVGCELADGSYLGGDLLTYNSDEDETEHRDLTLSGPITFRASDTDEPIELKDVGAVSVSARQIKFMTVTYLPIENGDNETDADGE
ncbi:MAG TPA: DUF6338 family protein [Acidimicrobiia bacterium]|nr:DUF6338 family protein [Acidimicrobiia bacterium]